MRRRELIGAALGLAGAVWVRDTAANAGELAAAIKQFAAGVPVTEGRVEFDIAPLVENGNTVPLTVSVTSPMTSDDYVKSIHVFNEKNPQPNIGNLDRKSVV